MQQASVVVAGGSGVGKSCLTIQFISGNFPESIDPTIEDVYQVSKTVGEKSVLFDITDTAGADDYQTFRAQWIRNHDVIVVVFDVSAPSSRDYVVEFLAEVQEARPRETFPEGMWPVVIVGNKIDLDSEEKEQSIKWGEELAAKHSIDFIAASAKTFQGVDEAFFAAAHRLPKKEIGASERVAKRRCVML